MDEWVDVSDDQLVLIKGIGPEYDAMRNAVKYAASCLRAIAAGEYKPVVHARWKLVSEGARCNLVKCTHCGRSIAVTKNVPLDKWRAAKPYCDQCGALMGKDDIHE